MASPKIVLYTNHGCPYAHRAHIALKESGLDYEEVIIDLTKPREPWYLEINPRGLVPSMSYNGTIITESAIVAQFIADAHPSHLLPPSSGPTENALFRARVAFFVDTFSTKITPHLFAGIRAASEAERDAAAEQLAAAVVKELEPALADGEGKGPFFAGREKLTMAEVQLGPFILRILAFAKPQHGLVSAKLPALLEQAPRFKRWAEATASHDSVTFIWNESAIVDRMRAKFAPKA